MAFVTPIGQSSADSGNPLNLSNHATGNPIPAGGVTADITVGHTVLIIVGALAALWVLGGFAFKSVRM